MAGLIKERSAGDPGLGVPDMLIALELVKASLLEESGVALSGPRTALIVAVALSVAIAGFAVFLMSP